MKKKISLALSIGVLSATVLPTQISASSIVTESKFVSVSSSGLDVYDPKIEEYGVKVKSLLGIGDEYEHFDVYRDRGFRERNIVELSWHGDKGIISVNIDESGDILNYWKHDRYKEQSINKFPSITREQGEKVARDFIKKVNPKISDDIKIREDDYKYRMYNRDSLTEHRYYFLTSPNDIPFNQGYLSVSVDSQTGEVRSYNSDGQKDLKFPDLKDIISKEEAKEIYIDSVDIDLIYRLREVDKELKPYLGYVITDTQKTVEAKTKEIIDTSSYYDYGVYGYLNHRDIKNVTLEEEQNIINSKKLITKKQAAQNIIDTFKLGEEYEIQNIRLKKSEVKDEYIWNVMVMRNWENGGSGTSSSVDAKTGDILNFSDPGLFREREEKDEKVKYNKEQSLKIAKEFVQKMNPEKYKEVEYVEGNNIYGVEDETKVYSFSFVRKANDIKVESSGFRVSINAVTGNISDYGYIWDNSELPLPENIISKDEAKEIIFKDRDLSLEYQTQNQDSKDIKLVYDFKEKHIMVDATTEEVIDPIKELEEKYSENNYTDIEDSFAKQQINKLKEYIVLFEGDEFKPKQEITQKEFITLLMQTKDMYYYGEDEEYMYERLDREGILNKDEKNLKAKLTREEAIKYIARAFGHKQLEDLGDIYKINYKDEQQISKNLRGPIAIATGLGIISGEGNFRPKDNLTREEAAVIIYNILNRSK